MFKATEETRRLKQYLSDLAAREAGNKISFERIQNDTGVTMNATGKNRLRTAAKAARVEFDAIKNYGIELAGPGNGIQIIGGRLARIDNAVVRAEKSAKNIIAQHAPQMTQEDQRTALFIGSVFGAIRAASENYKAMKKGRQTQHIIPVNTQTA